MLEQKVGASVSLVEQVGLVYTVEGKVTQVADCLEFQPPLATPPSSTKSPRLSGNWSAPVSLSLATLTNNGNPMKVQGCV